MFRNAEQFLKEIAVTDTDKITFAERYVIDGCGLYTPYGVVYCNDWYFGEFNTFAKNLKKEPGRICAYNKEFVVLEASLADNRVYLYPPQAEFEFMCKIAVHIKPLVLKDIYDRWAGDLEFK